jgi:2',3'-cyclic-nucleotide 2'-phosphodiesterase (5'-nucleotidase family)
MSTRVVRAALIGLTFFAATVVCRPVAARTSARPPADGAFTILHTNDMHGRHLPFVVEPGNATSQTGDPGRSFQQYARAGTVGGVARLASAIEEIRRARGRDRVILVDAGDTFGDGLLPNLTRGEAQMRLLDALGYQLMALGNHDFEYGVENTRRLQRLVRFPMRGANVIDTATGQPFLGDPTLVLDAGGVRVGLLALGYHNTDQTGNPDNTRGLRFTSGIDAARAWVPRLRERVDVVVVVSHQGTAVDSVLAERVAGIDVVVGGHSHDEITPPRRIGGAWVVQALSDASALGELTVTVRDGRVASVAGTVHTLWADRWAPDPRIAALVDSLRAPYRARLEEVIATAAEPIGRRYRSESAFDRLAADALRAATGADVAFLPGLGFGVTVRPGPITRETLYALLPHPAKVVTMRLTGAQILEVLEQSATNQRPADPLDRVGGLVQTSGLRWAVDLTRPPGRRVHDVLVGTDPLRREATYRVVTNGGLLMGTHRYATFARGADIVRDERSVTDVVEAALRAMGTVRAPPLGDVTLTR